MPILPIVTYPDPRLEEACEPVESFDEELRMLVRDMIETMHDAPGIGLAAPQVGRRERVAVVDLSTGTEPDELMVLVNPRVVAEADEVVKEEEGCLSFPELMLVVPRPAEVTVEYRDVEGEAHRVEAEGLLARCLHHEIDHLDGILFIERVSPLKRDMTRRKIEKKIRAGDW